MSTLTTGQEYLSAPEVAELLRVSHCKILAWIARGELRAVDLASYVGQRPRWKISRQDLEDFLARRAATPPPKPTRRRRRRQDDNVIEYY